MYQTSGSRSIYMSNGPMHYVLAVAVSLGVKIHLILCSQECNLRLSCSFVYTEFDAYGDHITGVAGGHL